MVRPRMRVERNLQIHETPEHRVIFGGRFQMETEPRSEAARKAKEEYLALGNRYVEEKLVGTHGTARLFIYDGSRVADPKELLEEEYSSNRNEEAFRRLRGVTKMGSVIRHITKAGRDIGGLGKEALRECERLAREEGMQVVYALTKKSNKRAIGSYINVGWIHLGDTKDFRWTAYCKFLD